MTGYEKRQESLGTQDGDIPLVADQFQITRPYSQTPEAYSDALKMHSLFATLG